jgi:hypothetical protein
VEEEAAPRAAQGAGWSVARFGLNSLYAGSALFVAAVGFLMVVGILVGLMRWKPPPEGAQAALGIASLVSVLLILVGVVLVCFVPSVARARRFAVASLLCTIGIVAVFLRIGQEVQANPGAAGPAAGWSVLLSLLVLATAVFLSLYTRSIGQHLRNDALRASSGRWIRVVLFVVLGWFVFAIIVGIVLRDKRGVEALGNLASLAFLIFSVVMTIWYLRNIRNAAITIRDARLEPESEATTPGAEDLAWEDLSEEPAS